MPKPISNEMRQDFLKRCMGDTEALEDVPQDTQRYAYCVSSYEDEDAKNVGESHTPTDEMAAEAKRGLAWRREFNRGGTSIGVARARDISNKTPLSHSTILRMVSYFARHEVDKQGQGWAAGTEGYPSAGRIAWALWGGDVGRTWAGKIADKSEDSMDSEYGTKHVSFKLEEKELGTDGRFSGYASVYSNVDQGGDTVMPGAFLKALAPSAPKPKMLWQHDPTQVIGVWEELQDDEKGLRAKGRLLTEIQKGHEALILLKAGAIDGLSIGYRVTDREYTSTAKGTVRQIKSADLLEISVVTFPMNPKSLVTDVKQLQSPREVETILRNAGVPAAFAKLVASHGFEEAKSRLATDQRDADGRDERTQQGFGQLLTEINKLKELMKNG
jgi:HK97 family phage prohead protease